MLHPTRKSPRLHDYDYAQDGAYFVTICTHHRAHLFGAVVGDAMQVNAAGEIVQACWDAIPVHFPFAELDAFVVMPNHAHGIVVILRDSSVGARHASPLPPSDKQRVNSMKPGSLSAIVGSFKSAATQQINTLRQTPGAAVWQRSFHDRIIRNEREWDALRGYILTNPARWAEDRFYRPFTP